MTEDGGLQVDPREQAEVGPSTGWGSPRWQACLFLLVGAVL